MSDSVMRDHWGDHFETLITEIARQAVICHVPLVEPGVVEAVLRNDEASCGSTNPIAFRKLRDSLMAVFVVQNKAYEQLGPLETEQVINEVRQHLRPRFQGKLGTPPPAA